MHGVIQKSELRELENIVKAEVMRGDTDTASAEEHYKEAGAALYEIKLRGEYGRSWEKYVPSAFGFSRRRADELIRIAKGDITLEESRERSRKTSQTFRNKNPESRDSGFGAAPVEFLDDDDTNVVHRDFQPPKDKPKPNKEAVKYCNKAIDVAVKFHDVFTTWLRTKPELSDDDKEALAESIQSAADTLARLAQQLR